MRTRLLLSFALLPKLCLAGSGFLGTKADGVSAPGAYTGPVSGAAIFQLLVALGIVLLLVRYVLPKALTKFNRKLHPSLGGIRIEESASFAGGNLYVVTARSKTLLLATSGSSVSCLADLTEAASAAEEPKTFQEMMEGEMMEGATDDRREATEDRRPATDDLFAQTLARLDRLDRISQK